MNQVGIKKNSLPGTTEEGAKKELPAPGVSKGKTTREKSFIIFPRSVFENPQLTSQDLQVYLTLASFRNRKTGLCCPTIKQICTVSRLDKKTVLKSLKKLADMGLISYHKRPGKGNRNYYELPWYKSKSTGGNIPQVLGEISPKAMGEISPITPQKNIPETGKDKTITETQKDPNNKNLTIRKTTSRNKTLDDHLVKYPNLYNLHPGTLEGLIDFGLSPDTINTLIDELHTKNIDNLFFDCLIYIQDHQDIKNPAGYFIAMAKKKGNVPRAIQEKTGESKHNEVIYDEEDKIPSVQDQIKAWEENQATSQQVKAHMKKIRAMQGR